jgi:hypothetical protein
MGMLDGIQCLHQSMSRSLSNAHPVIAFFDKETVVLMRQ